MTNELTNILRVKGVKAKGYGLVPKLIMQDRRLSRDAKAIYSYFCSYAGAGSTAFPSVKKIMYDLQFGTHDTYKKHMDMLIKYNYVEVEKTRDNKGKFTRNIYTLVDKPNFDNNDTPPDTEKQGTGQKPYEINISTDTESPGIGKSPVRSNHSTNSNNKSKINNTIKNNNKTSVVVKYIDKINNVTGGSISESQVINLLKTVDTNQIDKYIELYPLFRQAQNINNPVGFFITACINEYMSPVSSSKSVSFNNFEQHIYSDEDLEKLFEII